jgi:hypothetical protein
VTRDGVEKAAKLLDAVKQLEAARHEMQVSGYPVEQLLSDAANERIRTVVDAEIAMKIDDLTRQMSSLSGPRNAGSGAANSPGD